jgi:DNA modification methylase
VTRVERIGSATLYLSDCRTVLPTLSGVDAVVTDPPYGLGYDGRNKSTGTHGGRRAYPFAGWDIERPARETFEALLSLAPQHIIWGGNYFADMLPPRGGVACVG